MRDEAGFQVACNHLSIAPRLSDDELSRLATLFWLCLMPIAHRDETIAVRHEELRGTFPAWLKMPGRTPGSHHTNAPVTTQGRTRDSLVARLCLRCQCGAGHRWQAGMQVTVPCRLGAGLAAREARKLLGSAAQQRALETRRFRPRQRSCRQRGVGTAQDRPES